jgi:glycosyltransferase involved in cell wall biosynthesis
MDPRVEPPRDSNEVAPKSIVHLPRDGGGRRALERLIAAEPVACVIVATADPSRVSWPRMPHGIERRVWPTGSGARHRPSAMFARGTARGLDVEGEEAWLALATADRPPARSTLSLWDGDYVLVPAQPSERIGVEILQAFAHLADDWAGHDLVILGDLDPALERIARELGVGMRIHFVGTAERQAEWAWWSHAAAALLSPAGTISGGLVLRALAAGCPLHVVPGSAASESLRVWLARHGCVPLRAGSVDLVAEIARLLERGPEVEQAIDRGRALASAHDFGALVSRLRVIVPGLSELARDRKPRAA